MHPENSGWFSIISVVIFEVSIACLSFVNFWWRRLVTDRSLNCASCRGGWGEHSCPRSATAIHSMTVDRTPNLPIERQTLYHWAIAAPQHCWWTQSSVLKRTAHNLFTAAPPCPTVAPASLAAVQSVVSLSIGQWRSCIHTLVCTWVLTAFLTDSSVLQTSQSGVQK